MKVMSRLLRFAPALTLVAVLFSASGVQGQNSDRAKRLGDEMICMCGCAQILTACNHVGCTVSSTMLKKLDQRVASNETDDLLVQSFIQEYGEQVLALPPTRGFNSLVWMIPGIAFGLGLALVVAVIWNWRRDVALAPASGPAVSPEMLERARRQADLETED